MSEILKPSHCLNTNFSVIDNELVVGGLRISQLSERVGSTPFYAYDRQVLSGRIDLLRHHLPKEIYLRYAIKANPMPEIVAYLSKSVDGFDVSSVKEMTTALNSGISRDKITFSGPGKTDAEIAFAVSSAIVINLESVHQLESTIAAGEKLNVTPKVALRINPDFEVKGSKMKMGGSAKQFGIDCECVPSVLEQIFKARLEFEGFHIFSGSQNLNDEAVIETFKNSLHLAYRFSADVKTPIKTLNIGGGFGIPYFPGEKPLDLALVGQKFAVLVTEFKNRLPQAQLTLELGRYIIGEAGVYICRVIDKKVSRGHTFLIVDGGMHHHLAASGNLGQVIRKNYPVAVANRMAGETKEIVSIVGPLCTPLDLLADRVELPVAQIGDLIVIFQSGAYGLTASPVNFLSHPPPAEIFI